MKVITINAYNRASYTEQVLSALSKNDLSDWGVCYHQDGLKEGGSHEATKAVANKWLDVIAQKAKFVERNFYTENKNIAIRQYNALTDAFITKNAEYVIEMEDDLVPSTTYIATITTLLKASEHLPKVAFVSGGYRNQRENADLIDDWIYGTQMSWGTGHTREKWMKAYPYYQTAYEKIFKDKPYHGGCKTTEEWANFLTTYDKTFDELGFPRNRFYSQDAVQDESYIKAGMNRVIYPVKRNAYPIGEEGLHFTPEIFKTFGLDKETQDYEHPAMVITPDTRIFRRNFDPRDPSVDYDSNHGWFVSSADYFGKPSLASQ